MNRKITVRTQNGRICYFIIDPRQNIASQLAKVHGDSVGHGITYDMTDTQIRKLDYYCNEVIAYHEILRAEDTADEISLQWSDAATE